MSFTVVAYGDRSIVALRNMIDEVDTLIAATEPMPENRMPRWGMTTAAMADKIAPDHNWRNPLIAPRSPPERKPSGDEQSWNQVQTDPPLYRNLQSTNCAP